MLQQQHCRRFAYLILILSVAFCTDFQLIWSDEFDGAANSTVDKNNWLFDIGHCYPGCPAWNWGTGEIEYMTDSTDNVYQDGNGHLVIMPRKEADGTWTSGRIETVRSDFVPPANGVMRVEAAIKQPSPPAGAGLGYWPAFWMLGKWFRGVYTNWPTIGEIDIMEDVNALSSVWGTLHCGTAPGEPCNEFNGISSGQQGCTGCQDDFNIYAIELDYSVSPQQIRWYENTNNYFTVHANQVDDATWLKATAHPFFVILNLAIGGQFPDRLAGVTTPTDATQPGYPMLVDYVRVYYANHSSSDATMQRVETQFLRRD